MNTDHDPDNVDGDFVIAILLIVAVCLATISMITFAHILGIVS